MRRAGLNPIFAAHANPADDPLAELSRAAPEALTERLPAENAALAQATAELRVEVARLKGVKGRPAIKPSGMEQGTEPKPAEKGHKRGARSSKTARLALPAERIIRAEVPPGSRFKGGACPRAGHAGPGRRLPRPGPRAAAAAWLGRPGDRQAGRAALRG